MDEIWKPIPGYESRYEVSNMGRVRSFVTGTGSRGAVHYLREDSHTKYGHRRVTLSMNRKTEKFLVHRLVALAFIGPPPTPKHVVNHIDFCPANNRWDNLEWVTMQGNADHSRGRHRRGETHGMCRLTEDNVKTIRELYANGTNRNVIAKQFGITHQHCTRIVNHEVWTHVN